MRIIIITGLSGAGKSVALKTLEDIGCEAVDNVPLSMIPSMVASGRGEANTLAFGDLGQIYRTSPTAAVSPITEIHGLENINDFIHAAVNDSRQELLTAQPHGRRPATTLAVAENRDVKALERGEETFFSEHAGENETEFFADATEAFYCVPADLKSGDRLRIFSTGAYTTTYSAVNFNGFEPLKAIYI